MAPANDYSFSLLFDETNLSHTCAIAVMLYYIAMNIVCFAYMAMDKMKAIDGEWRVPNVRLWTLAILGGALGGFIAMLIYRHKIRKYEFMLGFSVLAIAHLYGLYYYKIFEELHVTMSK
jgi:uncharacterized membrane protein YsdA (DUF1294 family)